MATQEIRPFSVRSLNPASPYRWQNQGSALSGNLPKTAQLVSVKSEARSSGHPPKPTQDEPQNIQDLFFTIQSKK